MLFVKELVESAGRLTRVPSKYVFETTKSDDYVVVDPVSEPEAIKIPIIDYSLLTSGNPDQRSQVINELRNACLEWGFFMMINHGVEETLRDEMMRATESFFDLSMEEKLKYSGKDLFDPIRCGTSFNPNVEKSFLWRDYLKLLVHPHFNAPHKPSHFRFCKNTAKKTREMASELLKGISESLGLDENYINEKMGVESEKWNQVWVANMYPPCPQPELSMGLPPHSDHGLLTILMQNDPSIVGLQILHNAKWVPIHTLPNCFFVNTGDHLEILTNGKYKSMVHRAVVNNKATRISIGSAHGPPLDTIVSPAPELLTNGVGTQLSLPAYRGIKYRDFMELQQSNSLNGKSCLDRLRL
ncbi:putative 2-oxoglutarate/Fe(II)-dependent dioxygenase-like protein [Corchorus capsularis]|uniref:Putative 2-oxoglutarate/Fe(II)-dependent dioxygenase-like protein n=1 Tax=Corchorus capsularis TaxID=210143 RepID=A0A1R3JNN8_COCAP|nr:putative 2-oxoglutarate/Fe(II)-dependent dioxygenase-like protein [Corchorus capsularis]